MSSKSRRRGLSILLVIALLFIPFTASFAETVNYVYDDLNRLTHVIYDDGTVIEYTYDEVGNRQQKDILFDAFPVANADGPYSGIEGQAITLDGSGSTDSDGSIVKYKWDINNDGIYEYNSSSPFQNHTYTQQGAYTIRLRVTDNIGATNEATTTVSISDTLPTANFTASPTTGPEPLTVNFTNNSTGYDQPLSYQWDFDDNGSVDSIDSNPEAIYLGQGIYSVKLTATDSDGSTNTLTRTNYITVTPPVCSNLPVRIVGGADYSTLQSAYNAAGEGSVIQTQDVQLIENLSANLNKTVTIDGGYDCNYATKTGWTRLKGQMTISNGRITVKDFILKE